MTKLLPNHGVLRMWCDLYGPKSEAPIEGHLAAAIALISAAIGHKAPLRFARNTEPCTVNIILEGQSAIGRKTTTANTARELARMAVDDSEDDPGLFVHQIGHTSDAGLLELVAPKDAEQAKRWNEQITPPGHLLVWDEFGSLLGDPGQNRKGGDWLGRVRTTIMGLTNGWNAGSKTKSTHLHGSRCSVSILATMTREELEQRISTGLLHDGFLGRFALIRMTPTGRRLAIPPEFSHLDEQHERDLVDWLRRLAARRDSWESPFKLLTPKAVKLREDWYQERSDAIDKASRAGHDDDLAQAQGAAFGRLQALAMKVATVHAVSRLDDPSSGGLSIDESAVAYGQMIADTCLEEITGLAAIGGPAADQYQEKVTTYLAKLNGRGTVSKRDLLRHVKYRQLDSHHRWRIVEDMHPDPILIEKAHGPGPPSLTVRLTEPPLTGTELAPTGTTPSPNGTGDSYRQTGDRSVTVRTASTAQPSPSRVSVTTDDEQTHVRGTTPSERDTHANGASGASSTLSDDTPLEPGSS